MGRLELLIIQHRSSNHPTKQYLHYSMQVRYEPNILPNFGQDDEKKKHCEKKREREKKKCRQSFED